MKFGKRLAAEAARCWPEACLDYKAIKRALKHDLAAAGARQQAPTSAWVVGLACMLQAHLCLTWTRWWLHSSSSSSSSNCTAPHLFPFRSLFLLLLPLPPQTLPRAPS